MPYITEDLWNETSVRTKLLTHADWPTYTSIELLDEVASVEMNWVIALIEQIRSVRAEMRVNAGAKIPMIQLSLDATAQTALNNNKSMIMRLARVDKITTVVDAPKGAVTLAVEGGQFCLPLADIIDIEAEKNRLNKAIEKLEKELNTINNKLANEKFVNNAPDAVVAENRARIGVGQEELTTLESALRRVTSLK